MSEKNKFITEQVLLLGKYAPSGRTVVVDTALPAAKCRFLHNRISAQTLRKETDLVLAETKEEQLEHCAKLIRLLMPYQLTVDKLSEDVFDYFDLARALAGGGERVHLQRLDPLIVSGASYNASLIRDEIYYTLLHLVLRSPEPGPTDEAGARFVVRQRFETLLRDWLRRLYSADYVEEDQTRPAEKFITGFFRVFD